MSTEIRILVNGEVVGMIGSLSILPEKKEGTYPEIHVIRARFDKQKISEAFSRGFLHAAAQKEPLQIEIHDDDKLVTFIQNAWITDLPCTYSTDSVIIIDSMKLEAESVSGKKK